MRPTTSSDGMTQVSVGVPQLRRDPAQLPPLAGRLLRMQQHCLHLVLCRLPIQHVREQFSECLQCFFTYRLIRHIALLPS